MLNVGVFGLVIGRFFDYTNSQLYAEDPCHTKVRLEASASGRTTIDLNSWCRQYFGRSWLSVRLQSVFQSDRYSLFSRFRRQSYSQRNFRPTTTGQVRLEM